MRLLNIHTLELRTFNHADVPPYIITSHRWGSDEATFRSFESGANKHSEGYCKIVGFCKAAKKPRVGAEGPFKMGTRKAPDWLWIDTCCINKDSDAEVSRSINSMCHWYQNAEYCLVYLQDVQVESDFDRSAWFQRGWTLQELLAPRYVYFLGTDWSDLGLKASCNHRLPQIASITRIPAEVLVDFRKIEHYSSEAKFQWAQDRQTTEPEDMAYCLLGIFGVYLPLIYGEGRANAERRLREEIKGKERRSESEGTARASLMHGCTEATQWSTVRSASQALATTEIEP